MSMQRLEGDYSFAGLAASGGARVGDKDEGEVGSIETA
jgi:hypothetical protein